MRTLTGDNNIKYITHSFYIPFGGRFPFCGESYGVIYVQEKIVWFNYPHYQENFVFVYFFFASVCLLYWQCSLEFLSRQSNTLLKYSQSMNPI
ncbi:hypothetical protein MtrunA17_Chr6g0488801 [Medicago truncatula]|uniref:Transmembrane protein n=1 Tax=Medicago truncatula TaxID=3880 RepID=A0A396HKT8_MEDTR|nr:hypothetical protein MtrunA17_Chr6g0488801 [Medicago truncatula]